MTLQDKFRASVAAGGSAQSSDSTQGVAPVVVSGGWGLVGLHFGLTITSTISIVFENLSRILNRNEHLGDSGGYFWDTGISHFCSKPCLSYFSRCLKRRKSFVLKVGLFRLSPPPPTVYMVDYLFCFPPLFFITLDQLPSSTSRPIEGKSLMPVFCGLQWRRERL
mgnify:CR=1 FL=1